MKGDSSSRRLIVIGYECPLEHKIMAKKPRQTKQPQAGRSKRVKLSPDESLKRVKEFDQRKEAFIAALRKGKNRSVPA